MVATNNTKVISDLEYDLLAVLKNKTEAIDIYNTYKQDAQEMNSQPCVQLVERLQQEEMRQAEEVRQHLQEVMQKGKM